MSEAAARRIGGAAFWSYAGTIVERIVRFVVFALIARLVTPAAFGIVTLAALIAGLFQDLLENAFGQALVRQDDPDALTFDSAFWAVVGLGAATGAGIAAVAWGLADRLRPAGLAPVLMGLAAVPPIAALGSVHAARLTRELGFKAMSVRLIAASLVSGVVGVALAWVGWGAGALVVRALVHAGLQTGTLWLLCRWRPRARFSAAALRPLLPDSVRLMGGSLLGILNARGFDLVAGVALGAVALASFRVAGQTVTLVTELTAGPISAVAFAALARQREDPVEARMTFTLLARISALLIFPAFAGLAVTADLVFPLLFGGQWGEAVRVMPLLALLGVPIHVQIMLLAALFAKGRTDRMLHWQLAQGVTTVLTIAVGAPFGLVGVAIAAVAHLYLLIPLGLSWMRRDTDIAPALLARAALPSLVASAAMGAALVTARRALEAQLAPVPLLGVLVAGGVVFWLLALPFIARDLLAQALAARARR